VRLADFQTPLANTLHVQNQQQAGQQLQQTLPVAVARELQQQDIQETTTVQETQEDHGVDPIRQEEERGQRRRRMPRRRAAANSGPPPVPTREHRSPAKDGIHGIKIDVQA